MTDEPQTPLPNGCTYAKIQHIVSSGGDLCVVEAQRDLGFNIERVYWLHGLASDETRGAHAHRALRQLYVCAAGAATVALDDGNTKKTVRLHANGDGLIIGPMIWRDINDFAPGTVFLVLASATYDENDYIRDHEQFLKEVRV